MRPPDAIRAVANAAPASPHGKHTDTRMPRHTRAKAHQGRADADKHEWKGQNGVCGALKGEWPLLIHRDLHRCSALGILVCS